MKALATILMLGVLIPGAQAGDRFEPGFWRSTAFVAGQRAGVTGPRCVSVKEAESMNGTAASIRRVLETDPAWQGCSIRDVYADASRVDFIAACADAITTTSKTTYRGSSYAGTVTVMQSGKPALSMTVEGMRVGACP